MQNPNLSINMISSIATCHPDYMDSIEEWTICRDTYMGQKRIKDKGTNYLPKLSGQTTDDYNAYKKRALFYDAMAKTVSGMSGILFRKPITAKYPKSMEKYFVDTNDNIIGCNEMFKKLTVEQLLNARPSIFIDMPAIGGDPYPVLVKAEDFINWHEGPDNKLDMVIYKETRLFQSSVDKYGWTKVTCYRELRIEDGIYTVYIWEPDSLNQTVTDIKRKGPIIPEVNGRPLDFIPFYPMNNTGVDITIQKPPLLGLAYINLSHYMNSADLEHGRHFTALPTPVVSGVDSDVKLRIGSQTAWALSSESAKAYYLEFTGQGLQSLENALVEKERLMATLSSKLIEQTKTGSESSDTVRLRFTSDVATLTSMATVIESVMTTVYQKIAEWTGRNPNDISLKISRDFLNEKLPADTLRVLLESVREGKISLETFLDNLERGDYLQLGETAKEEAAKVKKELEENPIIPDDAGKADNNLNAGGDNEA